MTDFVRAPFNVSADTPLGSYVLEVGNAFTVTNQVGTVRASDGRYVPPRFVYQPSGGYSTTVSPSPDCVSEMIVYLGDGPNAFTYPTVIIRQQPDGSCYQAFYDSGTPGTDIIRVNSDGSSDVIATYIATLPAGSALNYSLGGAGRTISLIINGTTVLSHIDNDAKAILTAGYCGFQITDGSTVDSFRAYTVSSGTQYSASFFAWSRSSAAGSRRPSKTIAARIRSVGAITLHQARQWTIAAAMRSAGATTARRSLSRTISAAAGSVAGISTARFYQRAIVAFAPAAPAISAVRAFKRTVVASAIAPASLTVARMAQRSIAASTIGAGSVSTGRAATRTISAVSPSAGWVQRGVARTVTASTVGAASTGRQMAVSLKVSAIAASAASLARGIGRTVAAVTAARGAVATGRAATRTISAAVGSVASMPRTFARTVSAATIGAASVGQRMSIGLQVSALAASGASITRAIGRSIAAVSAASSATSSGRAAQRTITAATINSASIGTGRAFARTLAAVSLGSATATVRRVFNRTFAAATRSLGATIADAGAVLFVMPSTGLIRLARELATILVRRETSIIRVRRTAIMEAFPAKFPSASIRRGFDLVTRLAPGEQILRVEVTVPDGDIQCTQAAFEGSAVSFLMSGGTAAFPLQTVKLVAETDRQPAIVVEATVAILDEVA